MTRFHCLKCGDDAVYVYANDCHHFGCSGRIIPIATICSEPTVIDESDLAPGMVVVAVDERPATLFRSWLCQPTVVMISSEGFAWSIAMKPLELIDAGMVRKIAEYPVTP